MQLNNLDYILVFLATFVLTSFMTPLMRQLALCIGITDKPNQIHKTHKEPVPYLGGVAIVVGVVSITLMASIYSHATTQTFYLAMTILGPALLMAVIGLVDDIKQLKPWPRFVSQNVLGVIAAITLISTKTLGTPTGVIVIDFAITLFWIVGITNSINFFDNIDGGASGTVAISSFTTFVIAFYSGQLLIAAMSLVVAGSTLGFLIWNRPPARIYMGDAGALFLGILIASLTIRLDIDSQVGFLGLFVPLFVIAMPILDTSVAVLKRVWRGVSPFEGGRDHLSHRLMRMGLSKRKSVLTLWLGSTLFSLIALEIATISIFDPQLVTIVGVAFWIMLLVLFLSTADKD